VLEKVFLRPLNIGKALNKIFHDFRYLIPNENELIEHQTLLMFKYVLFSSFSHPNHFYLILNDNFMETFMVV
jgi:hypothetical protein